MKLTDNIYYRKMFFSFPGPTSPILREVYAVLLKGRRNILIDCGVSYNRPDIDRFAEEAGLHLEEIDLFIPTHSHADHVGGLKGLKESAPHMQIFTHPEGKEYVENIDLQFKHRPVAAFYYLMGGSVSVDGTLADNEIIDNGYPIRILHTPGHSKDSLSVYLPDEQVLISGDAIPYIRDIPIYDDLPAMKESFKKLCDLPIKTVLSGFCGMWSQEDDGDIFAVTEKYIFDIQKAVNTYLDAHGTYELSLLGEYVLECIDADGAPIPIFLRSLEEHIRYRRTT